MLQGESDLSLIIAQIVQKLKGSNLYAQLERQAWVSEAVGRDADPRGLGVAPAPSDWARLGSLQLRSWARKILPAPG